MKIHDSNGFCVHQEVSLMFLICLSLFSRETITRLLVLFPTLFIYYCLGYYSGLFITFFQRKCKQLTYCLFFLAKIPDCIFPTFSESPDSQHTFFVYSNWINQIFLVVSPESFFPLNVPTFLIWDTLLHY